jgi:hypothetical protein
MKFIGLHVGITQEAQTKVELCNTYVVKINYSELICRKCDNCIQHHNIYVSLFDYETLVLFYFV